MSVDTIPIDQGKGLFEPATDSTHKESKFSLFTKDWIQLQGYVGAALDMPIGQGDFETKYGKFDGSKTITDCVQAMKNVQAAGVEFGDPAKLRKQITANPALLATEKVPTEIYTHTAWIGQRVSQTAGKIKSGYQSVLDEVAPLPSKDQVEAIKGYLFDVTLGPIPLSETMSKQVGDLVTKLGKFEEKMNAYNKTMQAFVSSSGSLMTTLNNKIGELGTQIEKLKKDRDDAYDAWVNWTVAAVAASVGVALIGGLLAPFTFGASVAIGVAAGAAVGIGMGVKAGSFRAKYNEYCKQLKTKEVDLQKKNRLKGDLTGFTTQMDIVGPAMSNFMKSLQGVQGVFAKMTADLKQLGNDITPENVGTVSFLVKSKANYAIDVWDKVGMTAADYTISSLIDYDKIPFGQEMPEKKVG